MHESVIKKRQIHFSVSILHTPEQLVRLLIPLNLAQTQPKSVLTNPYHAKYHPPRNAPKALAKLNAE